MGVFAKYAGVIGSFFQIGDTGGPGVNANGAALETRNAANAAFAVHRGAPPVAANDFVTLGSLSTLVGPVNLVRIPIALVTVSSTFQLPAGSIVLRAKLDVTTPYSGGTTISLGIAGTVALFMATGDSTPTAAAAIYEVPQDTAVGGVAAALLVTINGGPAAGAGFALVEFSIPQT
jgi:hypothetical protein